MAKGLLDLVRTDSLNEQDVLLVNKNTIDMGVTVETLIDKVEERTDTKYVDLSGSAMTGPLIVTKIKPDMTGATDGVSLVEIGSNSEKIGSVHSNLLSGKTGEIQDISSTNISTENISITSSFSFDSGKATIQYNSSDASIDFIIN